MGTYESIDGVDKNIEAYQNANAAVKAHYALRSAIDAMVQATESLKGTLHDVSLASILQSRMDTYLSLDGADRGSPEFLDANATKNRHDAVRKAIVDLENSTTALQAQLHDSALVAVVETPEKLISEK